MLNFCTKRNLTLIVLSVSLVACKPPAATDLFIGETTDANGNGLIDAGDSFIGTLVIHPAESESLVTRYEVFFGSSSDCGSILSEVPGGAGNNISIKAPVDPMQTWRTPQDTTGVRSPVSVPANATHLLTFARTPLGRVAGCAASKIQPYGSATYTIGGTEYYRCVFGATWNGKECVGNANKFENFLSSAQNVLSFNAGNPAGHADWTTASIVELERTRLCRNGYQTKDNSSVIDTVRLPGGSNRPVTCNSANGSKSYEDIFDCGDDLCGSWRYVSSSCRTIVDTDTCEKDAQGNPANAVWGIAGLGTLSSGLTMDSFGYQVMTRKK